MSGSTNEESDDAVHPEREGPVDESPRRILYWWHVPERPGTGNAMLLFAAVWLVTLVALAVIIRLIFNAVG
ncbi:MAG: hypothetical protein QNJ12_03180 [Ilumatobacter sp.]|uniref:hypothetical protein n=1 Tax=Ilumatobacter sp. TaxID=1967498 RepID=UPI00260E009A|nr:hypothetical protein [Ilumatobacter sp.]MDJ0767763.1 hypothetical protein [Ilumatobacter sp.]